MAEGRIFQIAPNPGSGTLVLVRFCHHIKVIDRVAYNSFTVAG